MVPRWLCLTAHAGRGRDELFPAMTTPVKLLLGHFPSYLRGHSPAGIAWPVVMLALGLSLCSVACVPRCDARPRVALVLGYLCGYLSKYTILCSCFILLCWLCAQGWTLATPWFQWEWGSTEGLWTWRCQRQLRAKDHISFLFRNEQTTTAS